MKCLLYHNWAKKWVWKLAYVSQPEYSITVYNVFGYCKLIYPKLLILQLPCYEQMALILWPHAQNTSLSVFPIVSPSVQ